ncbi:MAG: hypothetical protein SVJ22_00930 [Halobacteriota archaeon]|nr:hypothetical protein [Halobacteriota archaeon]
MKRELFFGWLKINILSFAIASVLCLFFVLLFPDAMLGFVRSWGAYGNRISPTVLEPTSKAGLFVNILTRNSLMTFLHFIASLLLLSPLIAIMAGIFYSLGLVSAIDHFINKEIWYPLWHSPVLISIEVSFILLNISFASALGSEIFGATPKRKELVDFFKSNWNRLFPKQRRDWKVVFTESKREIRLFIAVVLALLLFGAFFEVIV